MIEKVAAACGAFVTEPAFNDFWLISCLTDYSFEEGGQDSKRYFRQAMTEYGEAGVPRHLVAMALDGINGNLKTVLERPEFGLGPVRRNKRAGQDLEFAGAKAEVKYLFDGTYRKYYARAARDWQKLAAVRQGGFPGPLFFVVFFIELPGRTWFKKRREVIYPGIHNQYRALMSGLDVAPCWPEYGPVPHRLAQPEIPLRAAIERRFDRVYRTSGWFQLPEQMRDAAVAACVWEYAAS